MTFFNWITIFKSKPGEVAPVSCWIVFQDIYMYIGNESLLETIWLVITEWKHDKHLAM